MSLPAQSIRIRRRRQLRRRSLVASGAVHCVVLGVAFGLPMALMRGVPQRAVPVMRFETTAAPVQFVERDEPIGEVEYAAPLEELPETILIEVPSAPWDEEQFLLAGLTPETRYPLRWRPEREVSDDERLETQPEPQSEPRVIEASAPAQPSGVDAPDTAPELIDERSPKPIYPTRAQRLGLHGEVVCRITVGRDGTVVGAAILTSSGHDLLDRIALQAVLLWHFVPATRGGAAVEVDVEKHFLFQLDE